MKTKLYHYQVYMPKLKLPDIMNLSPSNHAIEASHTDRYGFIELPKTIKGRDCKLIELETVNNVPTKLVVRLSYSSRLDLVLVLRHGGLIVTCWLNEKDDRHGTLDRSRYDKCA